VLAGRLYLGVSLLESLSIDDSQKLIVAPNELVKKRPTLAYHIAADAAGLGLGQRRDARPHRRGRADRAGHPRQPATIDNIDSGTATRCSDVRAAAGDPHQLRLVSWTTTATGSTANTVRCCSSPRELELGFAPHAHVHQRALTFTHGMGLTLGPVNQHPEGLPVLFIKTAARVQRSLRVTRPELYFGELTDSWVFARTHQPEFDYRRLPRAEMSLTRRVGSNSRPGGSARNTHESGELAE